MVEYSNINFTFSAFQRAHIGMGKIYCFECMSCFFWKEFFPLIIIIIWKNQSIKPKKSKINPIYGISSLLFPRVMHAKNSLSAINPTRFIYKWFKLVLMMIYKAARGINSIHRIMQMKLICFNSITSSHRFDGTSCEEILSKIRWMRWIALKKNLG